MDDTKKVKMPLPGYRERQMKTLRTKVRLAPSKSKTSAPLLSPSGKPYPTTMPASHEGMMPASHKKRMMELSSPGKAANIAKGYINSKKSK